MSFWCYNIAEKNGRNTTLAAILGFIFGIFAAVGYYVAGKKQTPNNGGTPQPA
jgi:amino acid transporter